MRGWKTKIATEGRPWYRPKSQDWSRIDRGRIDPRLLVRIPGGSGEHLRFDEGSTGRMSAERWREFVADIRRRGVKNPITVRKRSDGTVVIDEGNHRIRAAIEARKRSVPVEIQYYGGAEQLGLVFNPVTGAFSEDGTA